MRRSRLSLAVASAAMLLGGQLTFIGSAAAAHGPVTAGQPAVPTYPADSLRALAARVGLRIGTAVNPALLGADARYTRITAEQFSSVTPENAMKWAEAGTRPGAAPATSRTRSAGRTRPTPGPCC